MFTRLTVLQASLIQSFLREAKQVHFHGIDENELPVISYLDANGWHLPFAVRRSPRRKHVVNGIQIESTIEEPALPLRWLSDTELDHIDPEAHDIICMCARWRGNGVPAY